MTFRSHLIRSHIEHAIVAEQRALYAAHDAGLCQREAELELDLAYLKKCYFKYYHSRQSFDLEEASGNTCSPESVGSNPTADNYSQSQGTDPLFRAQCKKLPAHIAATPESSPVTFFSLEDKR